MVSLQSALLPEAAKPRPSPCLSLAGAGAGAFASTATSKKRKRDGCDDDGGHEDSRGEVVDGIELNFDAAPLPPEWQRCLDIKSGQIHYYNTRTHKRTWKDPRAAAPEEDEEVEEESAANRAPEGLDLELNLNFEPRRRVIVKAKRPNKPPAATDRRRSPAAEAAAEDCREIMVPAVCARCHMLVMMCRASPACPNCKFPHPPAGRSAALPPPAEPEQLKLGLRPLCCRD